MLPFAAPNRDDAGDLRGVVRRRRPAATRNRLLAAVPRIIEAYEDYFARTADLTGITSVVDDGQLRTELQGNYDLLFSNGTRSNLMLRVNHHKCLMCGLGEISTLDHYLGQVAYPEFSIFAPNLIPACDVCNRRKGPNFGATPETQFLHAFYHVLPDLPLLVAEVAVEDIVSIEYLIAEIEEVDQNLMARLRYQFDRLALGDRYRMQASTVLAERSGSLLRLYGIQGDAGAVRSYLESEAESLRNLYGVNHWQVALFRALAESEEFYSGGFQFAAH